MLDVVGELRYEAGKLKDCQVLRELETRERARSLQDDQKKRKPKVKMKKKVSGYF